MSVQISRVAKRPGVYRLETEQWLPRSKPDVFEFFADAFQQEAITPPWLNFQVITPAPIVMQPGLTIDYRLKLHGWPVRWRSEISVWEPCERFVDQQLIGPYRLWHHEHTFYHQKQGGQNESTLVRDVVHYAVTGGPLIHWLMVKRDLVTIFNDRQKRMQELLGEPANATL